MSYSHPHEIHHSRLSANLTSEEIGYFFPFLVVFHFYSQIMYGFLISKKCTGFSSCSGTKSLVQEADWECQCLGPQVCWMPNAMRGANNEDGAHQCSFEKCRVPGLTGCHDHGKPKWACPNLPLVHSQQERL